MDGCYGIFPTFNASELKPHIVNDKTLFLNRDHPWLAPVLTLDSLEENVNKSIINSRCRGWGWQFLVRWVGFGAEDDEWLGSTMLEDCKVLVQTVPIMGLKIAYINRYVLHRYKLQDIVTIESPGGLKCHQGHLWNTSSSPLPGNGSTLSDATLNIRFQL